MEQDETPTEVRDAALHAFLTNPKETYTVAEVGAIFQTSHQNDFAANIRYLARRGEIDARPKREPRDLPYDSVVKLAMNESGWFTREIARIIASRPTDSFVIPGPLLIAWLMSLIAFHEQSHCQHDMVDGPKGSSNRYCRKCFAFADPHNGTEHAYVDDEVQGVGNQFSKTVQRKACIFCLHVTAPNPNVDQRNEAKSVAKLERTVDFSIDLMRRSILDAIRLEVSNAERQKLWDSVRNVPTTTA